MKKAEHNGLLKGSSWRTPSATAVIVGEPLNPLTAFKLFVQPSLSKAEWLEDINDVGETTMSLKEWMGVILHAMVLSYLSGENLRVAMLNDENGYGCVVRGENEVVFIAQALASHQNTKKFSMLLESITARLQQSKKHFSQQDYPANAHMVIFCDIDIAMQEDVLAQIVSQNKFSIVHLFGYDAENKSFSSFVFSKEKDDGVLYKGRVTEAAMVAAGEQ